MYSSSLQSSEIVLFRKRIAIISLMILLIFSMLIMRLWYLQVLHGGTYADFSKGNRIRLVPLAGPRGVIYDRNGIALADNRPAYQLQLIREDTPDLETSLRNVAIALDIPYESLKKKVVEKRYQAPFKPIILDDDLDYKKAAIIETYQDNFPGVSIVVEARRFYPHDKVAAHVLGYVGLGADEQQSQIPANKKRSGMILGRSGIESLRNDVLLGTDGGKQVEVDHLGRELKVLNNPVAPIPGKDVFLTIDIQLQRLIYEAMRGKSGAVIVMRPKTGEILSLGSFPGFNPNLFASGISRKNWNRLVNTPHNPLENKVVQGQYPPGSIFKLLTAYAALETGAVDINTTYTCNGFFRVKGRKTPYKCWKWETGGHGTVNLKEAIQGSCNVYFYHAGQDVGVEKMHYYASLFGFGRPTGLELANEKSGLIPNEAWKLRTFNERWYLGETPPVAIGQGYTLVTPLQIINFINILANSGNVMRPTLMLSQSESLTQGEAIDSQLIAPIWEGMKAAVHEPTGTARIVRSPHFDIAAKTATSQVVGHKTLANLGEDRKQEKELQSHAWFVAFAPVEDPEISVAVLVEHGGSGATGAGPIARKIINYYHKHLASDSVESHSHHHHHHHDQNSFSHQLYSAFEP